MARGEQLGRQWRILQILISSASGKSVSELAERINCKKRTVYRDLEALQLADFPIYNEKKNGKNIWLILDSGVNISMPLSLSELMSLYFGRDLMNSLKDTVFHSSLQSLFNKIKTTLPKGSLTFLKQFEKNFKVAQQPYKYQSDLTETIKILNTAIEEKKCVDISYYAIIQKKNTKNKSRPLSYMVFKRYFLFDQLLYVTERKKNICL